MTTMTEIKAHRNYVNGIYVDTPRADDIAVRNPATGQVLSHIPDSNAADVDAAVAAAKAVQPSWEALPAIERAGYLRTLAAKIGEHKSLLARTIVEEQGKILSLAEFEVDFAIDCLIYSAEWARRIEGEILPSDRADETIFLFRHAIGVIGGILPWNFPFFLIARKLAPALVTGNTLVLKPSEETPNNAALFLEILSRIGLPPGVVNIVYGRGPTTGAALSAHPDIGMLSFTGSVETGSRIMAAAAPNITRVNLELGGKAPAIILADADLDLAVEAVVESRVVNAGQVCICAERVYVEDTVADEFLSKLSASMSHRRFGNPLQDQGIDYGPMINHAGQKKVAKLVEGAVAGGAELITGGDAIDCDGGHYFAPTLLAGCAQDSDVMQKEIFGPVIPVRTVSGIDEAIELANDCEYGLSSSLYSRDVNAVMRVCRELRFGETFVNRPNGEALQGFHAGMRKSGIGGADGKYGLYEHMQTHMVYLQT